MVAKRKRQAITESPTDDGNKRLRTSEYLNWFGVASQFVEEPAYPLLSDLNSLDEYKPVSEPDSVSDQKRHMSLDPPTKPTTQ